MDANGFYVSGDQPFGPLSIKCRPPTLIPRPETEDWVIRLSKGASDRIPKSQSQLSVLDICTGTGCIPLLLARACQPKTVSGVGVDISPAAIELAKENAQNALPGVDVDFIIQDLFSGSFADRILEANSGGFDIITCNPPYIPRKEYEGLSRSVRDHEDPGALIGDDNDGLSFYRRLVDVVKSRKQLVKPNGIIAVEHGAGQGFAVKHIFEDGLQIQSERVEMWNDPWGKDRAVISFL